MTDSDLHTRLERLNDLLTGVVALLAADRDERIRVLDEPRKPELILADAGWSIADIAAVLGKSRDTVKSTVRRARQ